jgi:midasin (ATPase involved in ribosome maturation)
MNPKSKWPKRDRDPKKPSVPTASRNQHKKAFRKNTWAGGNFPRGEFVWTDQALRLAEEILWNKSIGVDVMLLGEAGEGKTELPPQIAKLLEIP